LLMSLANEKRFEENRDRKERAEKTRTTERENKTEIEAMKAVRRMCESRNS